MPQMFQLLSCQWFVLHFFFLQFHSIDNGRWIRHGTRVVLFSWLTFEWILANYDVCCDFGLLTIVFHAKVKYWRKQLQLLFPDIYLAECSGIKAWKCAKIATDLEWWWWWWWCIINGQSVGVGAFLRGLRLLEKSKCELSIISLHFYLLDGRTGHACAWCLCACFCLCHI